MKQIHLCTNIWQLGHVHVHNRLSLISNDGAFNAFTYVSVDSSRTVLHVAREPHPLPFTSTCMPNYTRAPQILHTCTDIDNSLTGSHM